jgi:RNA recognition motif-containing protein
MEFYLVLKKAASVAPLFSRPPRAYTQRVKRTKPSDESDLTQQQKSNLDALETLLAKRAKTGKEPINPPRPDQILVENLPPTFEDPQLRAFFEREGWRVQKLLIPRHKTNGRTLGYAWVKLQSHADAEDAIDALQGREVFGRALALTLDPGPSEGADDFAEPEEPSSPRTRRDRAHKK